MSIASDQIADDKFSSQRMVDSRSPSDPALMSSLLSPVQPALAARTRAEAVDALGPGRLSLTPPDLQRLTAMLLRWRDLDPVLPSASV
jgi:hypothetical protein